MKKLMMGIVAAMAMGAMAETANTVKVTKFHQSYPYTGKATVNYMVGGALPANAIAEITINTDDASATFTQKNIVTGANMFTVDFASSFGGALLLTNASFVVTITEGPGGVQLWENGPYWAECNVGASKPEEYGYYFWWGDTVGYTNTGSGWISVKDGTSISFSPSGTAASTYDKSNSELLSAGYIDSTGNLVAAHDAATAHLGSPWRMPTDAEISALINNCTTTWITTNGVSGRLVTGTGAYANRSIFLPAASYGNDSYLNGRPGSYGYYWSSTPSSDFSFSAWFLCFASSGFDRFYDYRCYGQSVRPVRGFAGAVTVGIVTYDPSETQTTEVPVPYAWLDSHVPGVAHESEAYEATAKNTAANGRKVWECYVVGLDPQVATNDFRIASFPMKADGTPDFANVTFDPPQERWNVPDAPIVWKGAAQLEGPWRTVTAEGGSSMRFFKAVVFGDADDDDAPDSIQLWEGGPYWATKNVGAEKPWDYGYYFWWGDTVGYTNTGSAWISVTDGTGISFVAWGTAASTYDRDNSTLRSEGWIDSTGNLTAAHDAATAYLGSPWRMPTADEIDALTSNCTTTWITTNGVSGRLVTGTGAYANRSIFLPAAGYGNDSSLYNIGSNGYYWSSTPSSNGWGLSCGFQFGLGYFIQDSYDRFSGRSVRPVRDSVP